MGTFAANLIRMIIRVVKSFLLLTIIAFSFSSCKKDKIDSSSSARLTFSSDTIFFDTVFTTIGSVTQRLLVYNSNNSKIKVSSIHLSGGEQSFYKINIDGVSATTVTDVEIAAHDSLFIFIRVTIDPNNHNNPLVVTDSIQFITNGNLQDVKLIAWGQDAWFYKNKTLKGTILWDSLKPYVIYGYLRVDTAASLTILPGSKVYFHKNAYFAVSSEASLKVNGTLEHPVRFQGDRLDPFYRDLPGQWDGIYLERGSKQNVFDYAIIKNGSFGIFADSISPPDPFLTIDNTIIQNITGTGIYAYTSNVTSTNCVIGDCGGAAIYLDFGGNYNFRQLTIGNYWSSSVRTTSSLVIRNYTYDTTGNKISNALVQAYFGNCIIYGNEDEEIFLDSLNSALFNFRFDHGLLRTKKMGSSMNYIECMINKDPVFVDPLAFNYAIDSISPAIEKGIPMGVATDIKGVERGLTPDLGAYQYVKKQ